MNLQNELLKAEFGRREELCSSQQPAWSGSYLRSRAYLLTTACSASHLDFLKHLGLISCAVLVSCGIPLAALGEASKKSIHSMDMLTPAYYQVAKAGFVGLLACGEF
jgi:hypothetical protein